MQNIHDISIFDVLGPEMIGPSSSHTAGACRLALLARGLAGDEPITDVTFTLYGSFADTHQGHGTDLALLAGLLGFASNDVRLRDARMHADQQGLRYTFAVDHQTEPEHPNTVDIRYTTAAGRTLAVRGCSIGGGQAVITRLNGFDVHFTGQYPTLVVLNEDKPGVVARLTALLAAAQINIAFMRLYREQKGDRALTLIECDDDLSVDITDTLRSQNGVLSAIRVEALHG